MLQQGLEGVRQHFVGAVAHEYLARADAVGGMAAGDGQLQGFGVGIGVQAQAVADFAGDGLQGQRRGAIRALVGIELDQAGDLGLFAGGVGRQAADDGAPELAHEKSARPGHAELRESADGSKLAATWPQPPQK
jgi:hypothetical protein